MIVPAVPVWTAGLLYYVNTPTCDVAPAMHWHSENCGTFCVRVILNVCKWLTEEPAQTERKPLAVEMCHTCMSHHRSPDSNDAISVVSSRQPTGEPHPHPFLCARSWPCFGTNRCGEYGFLSTYLFSRESYDALVFHVCQTVTFNCKMCPKHLTLRHCVLAKVWPT